MRRLILTLLLVLLTISPAFAKKPMPILPPQGAIDVKDLDTTTPEGAFLAWARSEGRVFKPSEIGFEETNCIHFPDGFKDIAVVGLFAHNRGCMTEGAVVGGWYFKGIEAATPHALRHGGWATAAVDARLKLARAWFEGALMHGEGSLLTSKTDDFDSEKQPFEAPGYAAQADGTIIVEAWLQRPSGSLPQTVYHRVRVVFAEDGSLASREVITGFTVDMF